MLYSAIVTNQIEVEVEMSKEYAVDEIALDKRRRLNYNAGFLKIQRYPIKRPLLLILRIRH